MKKIKFIFFTILLISLSGKVSYEKALKIHKKALVIDGHCDVPMLLEQGIELRNKREEGEFDLERMEKGGLDLALFAIFTPNSEDDKEPLKKALKLISCTINFIEKNKDKIVQVKNSKDIENLKKIKKKGIMISMENASPIEEIYYLNIFYNLGVRVIGLTHSNNNKICDSSTSEKPKWDGLSPYGKELVKEINKLGIVIDVSHSSDKTVLDVLEISKAPVIASHSCCRAIVPTQRNIPDELIKKIAERGGVIMVNFYAGFLDKKWAEESKKTYSNLKPKIEELKKKYEDQPEIYFKESFEIWKKNSPPPPDINKLIEHIEHIIKLVGVDYVGIGSDFEGAGTFMENLKDVSELPNLTYELLKRGYKKRDVKKILGENFLRVLKEVEKFKIIPEKD